VRQIYTSLTPAQLALLVLETAVLYLGTGLVVMEAGRPLDLSPGRRESTSMKGHSKLRSLVWLLLLPLLDGCCIPSHCGRLERC
jgi:hypothetical protein